jgi:CheY-like chemotaxis protein
VANLNDVTILLVEDDPGHARLIVKNLRRAGLTNQMEILSNGQEAVDYLFGNGQYAGTPHYSSRLILLDLNLPVMDGYDVLRQMKKTNAPAIFRS